MKSYPYTKKEIAKKIENLKKEIARDTRSVQKNACICYVNLENGTCYHTNQDVRDLTKNTSALKMYSAL